MAQSLKHCNGYGDAVTRYDIKLFTGVSSVEMCRFQTSGRNRSPQSMRDPVRKVEIQCIKGTTNNIQVYEACNIGYQELNVKRAPYYHCDLETAGCQEKIEE